MAVTSGFFNAINGDRRYNSKDFGSMFEGVIADGVYATVGDKFRVIPREGFDSDVVIGVGRAWFNESWLKNSTPLLLGCGTFLGSQQRYDMIALVFDHRREERHNYINVFLGTASSVPQKPTITNTDDYHVYPIAYIHRYGGQAISESHIENVVGTEVCPFAVGLVEQMSIDQFTSQWEAQWDEKMAEASIEMENWSEEQKEEYSAFLADTKMEIQQWYLSLSDMLSENTETKMANEIFEIQATLETLRTTGYMYDPLEAIKSNGTVDMLTDQNGNPIEASLRFGCGC